MSGVPVQHWNFGIGPITCHAWNKDRTQIAVSASSNEIYIFEWKNGDWVNVHTLSEHDLPVTGLDWGTKTNRIVSCSQDKNAFVWTFDKGVWKPELVLVRFNRAATYVKWSPLENKFAVGSGAKLVSVCYYEKENDWWVSKQIKKPIRSTVTCLDWHPNNVLLAIGSCDFKCRVFSAYVKEVDEKPSPNPWGQKMPFGQLMSEYSVGGWVHRVAFSPSGCRLAFVSHDSSVSMVDSEVDNQRAQQLRTIHLPFTTVEWITENSIVAAGHDCSPVLFVISQNVLKEVCKLDVPAAAKSSQMSSALQMFKNIDRNAASERVNTSIKTLHQNRITQILPHSGNTGNVSKFTTCGTDGIVALWDLKMEENVKKVEKVESDEKLTREDVWTIGDMCVLCSDVCDSITAKKTHELKPKHIRKLRLFDFYTSEVMKYSNGPDSTLYNRYKLRKMKVIGLEFISEIHMLWNNAAVWACSLCFVAGGNHDSADAHIGSLGHIRKIIEEVYPEEIDNIEYDENDLCDMFEKFTRLAERIFDEKGGLQTPQVVKMNLSQEDAQKKFVLQDIGDSMSLDVNSKDTKKAVLHCKLCNELVPTHKSTKYTVQRAREAHLNNPTHQIRAGVIGCIEEFELEEIYDKNAIETAAEDIKWREDAEGYWRLNTTCGMRGCIEADEEVFCSLCFCNVEEKEGHFSSELHVINFLASRFPYETYFIKQLPAEMRRKRAVELLSKTFLENDSVRRAPLTRFPRVIQAQITEDVRIAQDWVQDIVYNDPTDPCGLFCHVCFNVAMFADDGKPMDELKINQTWLKHISEFQHYETATRRACFAFDDRFFVPFPSTVAQYAVVDKGKFVIASNTEIQIQTQCDVGLEYMVEDLDNNEITCQICARIFKKENSEMLNWHIRSISHLKQYLLMAHRPMAAVILKQKTEKSVEDLLLEWLQRHSAMLPTKMRVYSMTNAKMMEDWMSVSYRTLNSLMSSTNEFRDVYETVACLVDKVACDGAELVMVSARDALNALDVKFVHVERTNPGNEVIYVLCKCSNCELVFTARPATWIRDILDKHIRTDDHYERSAAFNENRYDSYGISEEMSSYTVKQFEQKDPEKKVTWQWNPTSKTHSYVLNVVGLEDVVERRSLQSGKIPVDFFCQLCAKSVPKRAALLESHVRDMSHVLNYVHKHRSRSIIDIENINMKYDDKGKELRKYISSILKTVTLENAYCMRIYDPVGEAEKRSVIAQQRAKEIERKRVQEEMRVKAAEDRKRRLEESQRERERNVDRMRKIAEEKERREAEAREREKVLEMERAKRLEIALKVAQENEKKLPTAAKKIPAIDLEALRRRTTMELEKKRLEAERIRIQARMNQVNPNPYNNGGAMGAQHGWAGMAQPNMMAVMRQAQQPPQQQLVQQMLPSHGFVAPPHAVPPPGVPPPGLAFQRVPPPSHGFVPPPSNFRPIAPKVVQDVPAAVMKRPSLRGRSIDPILANPNLIKSRRELIDHMMKKGAERIPLAELPEEFSRTANGPVGALGVGSIYEVICLDDTTLDSYFCTLCAEWTSAREMKKHVVKDEHRLAYMYNSHKMYHKTVLAEKDRSLRKVILQNFSRDIQQKEQPPPKVEHRMVSILNKETIERLWPGYEGYFYEEAQFKSSGFQEVRYNPVPVPAPISKQALGLDDDDPKEKRSRKDKSRSPERRSKDKKRRSRTRSRSRERRRRSRSRERYRKRSRSRSRSSSRSRSPSRERSSRKRNNSWEAQTDAFLAKVGSGEKAKKRPANESPERSSSDFAEKLATLKKMREMGLVKEAEIDIDFRRQKPPAQAAAAAPAAPVVEDKRGNGKEDENSKMRKMLGVMITMQNQVEQRGGQVDSRDMEKISREMGLNMKESTALLAQINSTMRSEQKSSTKIDLASFGISPMQSAQQPPNLRQPPPQLSAYNNAVSSINMQPPPMQMNVSAYSMATAPSSYQTSASRIANMQKMMSSPQTSNNLNMMPQTVNHPSYFEQNAKEIYKDSVSYVYPTTASETNVTATTAKTNEDAKKVEESDEDTDDEYSEIMSVLGKKKENKGSGSSTPQQPQQQQQKVNNAEKSKEPTIPGQRMALARTFMPNGERIGVPAAAAAAPPVVNQPAVPGLSGVVGMASSVPPQMGMGIPQPTLNRVVPQQSQHVQQQQQPQMAMYQPQHTQQQYVPIQQQPQQVIYGGQQQQPMQYGIQHGFQMMPPQMQQQQQQPMYQMAPQQQQPQQMIYQQPGMMPQYAMQQPQQAPPMYMHQQQQQMMATAPPPQQQQPQTSQYGIGGNQQYQF